MNTKTTCASTKKLIELRSGYSDVKYGIDPYTGQIVAVPEHEKGIGAHFKRNAATYAGTALGVAGAGAALGHPLPFLAGVLGGAIIDKAREGRAMNRIIQDQAGKELRRRESVGMSAREELDTILFDRGDYAEAAAQGMLKRLNPAMRQAYSPQGGAAAFYGGFPKGSDKAKRIADALRAHKSSRIAALRGKPHNVNTDQDLYAAMESGLPLPVKAINQGLRGTPWSKKTQWMSAKDELNTILFANDPRPRDQQGQFTDANGNMIDPNSIHAAYKQQMQQGRPQQQDKPEEEQDKPKEEESKAKKLISKLNNKESNKKESDMKQTNMSAREELNTIMFMRGDIFKKVTGGIAVPRVPKGAIGDFYVSGGKRYRIDAPALQAQDLSVMREMLNPKYKMGEKRTLRLPPYRNLSAREELDSIINFEVDDANAGKRARMAALKYKLGTDIQAASDRAASYGQIPGALGGAYLGFRGRGTLGATLGGATVGTIAGGLLGRMGSASNERKRFNTMLADAKGQ